ncbi:MAG TPA: tRNA pseudouridine synthase A, partial [Terriglobia bacterium]|nr:tRNA pseudouridine synthase A [Terriglobia bacterium]
VAHFKTACSIPPQNLMKALNGRLPTSVRIKEALEAPLSFHSRFNVVSKTYRYRILLTPVASPFIARFAYHYPYSLDQNKMNEAARHFEGEHDFTSFAAAATKCHADAEKRPSKQHNKKMGNTREIFRSHLVWRPTSSLLTYEISGNGFLHHMVRNIVGTLVEVGRGAFEPSDIPRILAARDRTLAGPTAPAHGLCLWKVEY